MAIDFKQLEESPHLLDVLVQMEDVLDSFDIYVFDNWVKGEIVHGPKVRRYWFDFTLRYKENEKPSDKGSKRLIKHGIKVTVDEVTIEGEEGEPEKGWEVKISIPSNLIKDMNAAELDFYDDEVDTDDVKDAQDGGMGETTGIVDDGAISQEEPSINEEETLDEPF